MYGIISLKIYEFKGAKMIDICIVGGGASGLAAAVSAARENRGKTICILEKKEKLGKKLAASGNGRCNLTNRACSGVSQTLEFFSSLGVLTRTDREGRVYPYSNQAKDVVYALTRSAELLGVEWKTGCAAEKIRFLPEKKGFQISCKDSVLKAKRVLLACGGKAGPQFGTSGDGYMLAKSLGHRVTRLSPVLTGLEIREDMEPLKGIRAQARVGLKKDGKLLATEAGEVQFNADGISGICVMNLSRLVRLEPGEAFADGMARYRIGVDFLPDLSREETADLLKERGKIPGFTVEEMLLSLVPSGLKRLLAQRAGIAPDGRAREISEEKVRKLAEILKSWECTLRGTKGWKYAQCTAGGIALEELDETTMESRLVPGLYIAGELLDYDGPCGGFNLQNAWETGMKAGKAMANGV